MKLKKYVKFILPLMLLLMCFPGGYAAFDLPEVDIQANTALLVDPQTDTVLFEKNIDTRVFPASVTKIMTTLIVLEHGELTDQVTASASAFEGLDPQGSTQNIKEGETMTLEDLLYCVMVASANEACNIAAEHIAGSVPEFVKMMNEEAARLGCENTHFMNTHGLHDPNHYTSARDIYLITKEAMKNPRFMEIANTLDKRIPPTNKTETERVFYTTNHLISKYKDPSYIYHQAKGVKTGHTSAAGYCLVSSAEKNGYYFISVIMGASRQEDGKIRSFTESKELLEWGFDNFETKQLISSSEMVAKVPVLQGLNVDEIVLVPESKIERLLPQSFDLEKVERVIDVESPDGIMAPIARYDVLGEITIKYDGAVLGAVPLVAAVSVERSQIEKTQEEVVNFFGQAWVRYTIIGIIAAVVIYSVITVMYNIRGKRKRRDSMYSSRYRGKKGKH